MELSRIRNFSIIAHIDHGKSTLADRMLEVTGTIEKRKMKEQVLDSMELERERGITIKMQPVRMKYARNGIEYELNLIDTPGHIDFSYEVSRSLKAVEGAILLVDATQGVQAQTLSVLAMARELNLRIIPVVNKIDLPMAMVAETKEEIAKLLDCYEEDIIAVSGKTGENVDALLAQIVELIPPPHEETTGYRGARALVFDFEYSTHRGIVLYVRVMDGQVSKQTDLRLCASEETFSALEVGAFNPEMAPVEELAAGEIGYIVTGIKKIGRTTVGDTVVSVKNELPALPGYLHPKPVVWASLYPESQDDLNLLRASLQRLKLQDASISFEEETSPTLGRGFRCGFLGMLHLEIISERLKREFGLTLIVASPTVSYEVETKKGTTTIYSASLFPEENEIIRVREPWVDIKIITPARYLGDILQLLYEHEAEVGDTENFGHERSAIMLTMPLRELMRNFFDELKSVSSGYASLSYEIAGLKEGDVVRMDVLVADEPVAAFARIVSRKKAEREAEEIVDLLKEHMPRVLFAYKIQARALGRIISSRSVSAMKKDVTGYLYGGDRTRKMKLWEKQKRGKKRMKESGKVNITQDVFLRVMRGKQ